VSVCVPEGVALVYIYIYIYMCVCVCVCVYIQARRLYMHLNPSTPHQVDTLERAMVQEDVSVCVPEGVASGEQVQIEVRNPTP